MFHVKHVRAKSALIRNALTGIPHPAPLPFLSPQSLNDGFAGAPYKQSPLQFRTP